MATSLRLLTLEQAQDLFDCGIQLHFRYKWDNIDNWMGPNRVTRSPLEFREQYSEGQLAIRFYVETEEELSDGNS
jgi:hypothetical protein